MRRTKRWTRNWRASPSPIAARRATASCVPTARRPTKESSISQTGEFLRQSTHQGLHADSAWARGLAWSLYGYSKMYALTDAGEFLEWPNATPTTGSAHLPADKVP